uniref:Homeodomain-containing protein n=1 Tax=Borely moumouvirus TaxID=2712067 RepID=A0A6G6ABR1_9VIRU
MTHLLNFNNNRMNKIIIIYSNHFDSFEESVVQILSNLECQRKNGVKLTKVKKFSKSRLFTTTQLLILEETYKTNKYISLDEKIKLSKNFGVTVKQISIWFANRRAFDARKN